ncbi:MAG TPA: ribosome small subunit-dependent GTPase A [Steroidobacteraceae bacterium]|nr:ribosome small subunit-dependent GTPase A [Steroidobacteraceae bacterium]
MSDEAAQGSVVECFGRRVVVAREPDGAQLACKLRGRRLSIVAGDRVTVAPDPAHSGEWIASERLPRRNVLLRSDSRGLEEPIAANLDQLGVVVAARPECDPFIVDRYFAGASYARIEPLLIVNKADLENGCSALPYLAAFSRLGVPVVHVSAMTHTGLEQLIGHMRGKRTLLAGQSGVGKSSLTNALVGSQRQAISALSSGSGAGRHTTVSSSIIALPWGELADSPGVRDYAPPVVPLSQVQHGFTEIAALSPGCRFQDCLHHREPHCAVRAAAEAGLIDPRRYESYRRLLNLTRQLEERRRGWGG